MNTENLFKMETSVVLVVLIGLPGVGKSSVCEKLPLYLKKRCKTQTINIIHVCYDHLIPLSVQVKFAQLRQNGEEDENEGENWKSARRAVYSRVDQLIECLTTKNLNLFVLNFFSLSSTVIENDALFVILLDDNFYYRSMRYEYFQLARKYTIGFCQLYIECTTEVAVSQNMQREIRVPTIVVKMMGTKLQPPLPSEHKWESTTFVLQSDNFEGSDDIWNMIHQCYMSPVPPLEDRELEIAEARLHCSRSVAHQADIYLRSLVGQVIKEAQLKGKVVSGDLSALSRGINAGRQSVLAAVRDGTLCFPYNVAEAVNDDNREEFQSFLECELRKKLP